ncbi:MAG TPA: hypothetical protein VJ866_10725 [Pyrinomonadaceae bacterium]|nr:hypothetical protein [Pyrinomonadaceae bacterium]
MPTSPKTIEEKIERMLNAWGTLAPQKSFGGMTLAQFEAAVAPSLEARRRIEQLDDQRVQAVSAREDADEISNARVQLVVNGVRADPTEGPDSALYKAFGYTPDSERKSGLHRKRTDKPPTT